MRHVSIPARKPLQMSRDDRRRLLSRHFIDVVEDLIDAGAAYADLSVERLITVAGISRSTFYVYFEDKGDLLGAMAADVIGDLLESGRPLWELPDKATRDDLREALRPPLELYREHRAILGAVVEAAATDPGVREQHERLIEAVIASLADHIEAGQRRGSVAPELDPRRTAEWIGWMHERGMYQLIGGSDSAEAEQLLAALTGIIWRTLYEGYRPN